VGAVEAQQGYGRSMRWWNRRPETTRDAVGAIPLVLIFVVGQQGFAPGLSATRGVLVVLAIVLAMTTRRRWPVAAYLTALAIVALAQTGLELLGVIGYSLIVYEPRARPALVAAVSALTTFVGYLQHWPAFVLEEVAPDLAIIAVVSILPVLLGSGVRRYRSTTAEWPPATPSWSGYASRRPRTRCRANGCGSHVSCMTRWPTMSVR
jgi:hypothetical protein